MRLRPDSVRVLLAVAGLAFSQGCGSCGSREEPVDKGAVLAPAKTIDPRFMKTRAKDTALTLDATPAESLIPEAGTVPVAP